MSGSTANLANPLGPGVPMPGGAPVTTPGPGAAPPGGGNALAPGAGGGGMPSSPEALTKVLQQHYGEAKTRYQETGKSLGLLDHVRKSLERLADKGDMVTQEHVIDEAGKLVGHGVEPMALAGLLADMPQEGGGEALGGWVQGHAIAAAQGEQQLLVAHNVARHEMGVAAMHMLAGHTLGARLAPPTDERMDGGNQLDAGPPASGDRSMTSAGALGQRFMNSGGQNG